MLGELKIAANSETKKVGRKMRNDATAVAGQQFSIVVAPWRMRRLDLSKARVSWSQKPFHYVLHS